MLKRRLRAIIGFFLIYVAFVGMAIALFLYTPGLSFQEENEKLFLKNNSVHIVQNIKVELADGTPIDCISQLAPGSMKELYVAESKKPARILAFAPFHATVEKTLLAAGKKAEGISHKTSHEMPVIAGKQFSLNLEICSKAKAIEVSIAESHEQRFFKEKSQSRSMRIGKGECINSEFLLTPQERGTAKVKFVLEAENYNETIIEEIQVE
ncbi:MAG: hypothetical protein QXK06_02280 [Candidatus Diapherotrites archaeon]